MSNEINGYDAYLQNGYTPASHAQQECIDSLTQDTPANTGTGEIYPHMRGVSTDINIDKNRGSGRVFSNTSSNIWPSSRGGSIQREEATNTHTNTPTPPFENNDWPAPRSLPEGLLAVEPFDFELLPLTLRAWVKDIAERVQCPPDFVAVSAMAAAATVLGRKIGIRPQRNTDWTVIPNLWGMIVGRPGMMKSPAMSAALAPLDCKTACKTFQISGVNSVQ